MTAFEEAIRNFQRIQDTTAEAIIHLALGQAYKNIPAIRNLEAAEAAYKLSLAMLPPNDAIDRSRCIKQIGMVRYERYREACQRGELAETLLKYAQHYHKALALCHPNALADISAIHHALGNLYYGVGQTERAREHYEKDLQICEKTGDRYSAGQARFNMAHMFHNAAGSEATPARQRDLLRRAQVYAQAALHDFQQYQGRAADMEAMVHLLLRKIEPVLAQVS